jgi:aryl sulfotransferase
MATASADQLRMPVLKHLYQNHVLDSTRWNFVPLRDDIIVATSYKAGTTWMQAIVGNLIFGARTAGAPGGKITV